MDDKCEEYIFFSHKSWEIHEVLSWIFVLKKSKLTNHAPLITRLFYSYSALGLKCVLEALPQSLTFVISFSLSLFDQFHLTSPYLLWVPNVPMSQLWASSSKASSSVLPRFHQIHYFSSPKISIVLFNKSYKLFWGLVLASEYRMRIIIVSQRGNVRVTSWPPEAPTADE